jgi:hypothetical protein
VFAVAVVILLVNILIYRELHKGHITTIEKEQAARRAHFPLAAVRHLILSGTIWVNIIPSDSNVIQVPEEAIDQTVKIPVVFRLDAPDAMRPSFRQSGDTLYVSGNNDQPLHRPFADWFYRQGVPQINVYASGVRDIQVVKGQVVVRGQPAAVSGTSLQLVAQNSTVWLGELDNRPEGSTTRRKLPDEFFDSVSLHLTNSILLLNRPATIGDLWARMDSSSELNDRSSSLGGARIVVSPDSRASFTGKNLSKLTFISE